MRDRWYLPDLEKENAFAAVIGAAPVPPTDSRVVTQEEELAALTSLFEDVFARGVSSIIVNSIIENATPYQIRSAAYTQIIRAMQDLLKMDSSQRAQRHQESRDSQGDLTIADAVSNA